MNNLANDCTSFSRIGLYNCGRCPRALHGASSNMRSKELGRNGGEVWSEATAVVSYSCKCSGFSIMQAVVESWTKAVILVNPSFAEFS